MTVKWPIFFVWGSDEGLLWISTVVCSLSFSLHTCFPFLLTVISNFQKLEKQRRRCYDELRERIEREKKIRKISEELELQKNLMVCNTGEGKHKNGKGKVV